MELFAALDLGLDTRHVASIWPLWDLFDFPPRGRGNVRRPGLAYEREWSARETQ
jgi:hypothetical protein